MYNPFPVLIDLIFPSRCVSCSSPANYREHSLCGKCRSEITLSGDSCPVCSSLMIDSNCVICAERAFYPDRNICISDYEGPLKDALFSLKFSGNRRISQPLGEICAETISRNKITADLITTVPVNKQKLYKRGYNQSELIARRAAEILKIPFAETMTGPFSEKSQKEQSYDNRFLNVIGRYSVIPKAVSSGMDIIIIDDVFTTGATINECARILKDSGAKSIFSVTLARTGIKRLDIF